MIEKFKASKWNSDRLAVFAVFVIVFLGNEFMQLGISSDAMTDFMYLCFGLIGFKTLRGTAAGSLIESGLKVATDALSKKGEPTEEAEAPADADNDASSGQNDR